MVFFALYACMPADNDRFRLLLLLLHCRSRDLCSLLYEYNFSAFLLVYALYTSTINVFVVSAPPPAGSDILVLPPPPPKQEEYNTCNPTCMCEERSPPHTHNNQYLPACYFVLVCGSSPRGGPDSIALPVEQRAEVVDNRAHVVFGHLVARGDAKEGARHVHESWTMGGGR